MSSFNRRSFLILTAALAGCGFKPAYAPDGVARLLLNRVSVAAPKDRETYAFVAALESRLGRTSAPVYRLSYGVETRESGVGITPEGEISRYHISGTATYSLLDHATGAIVASGTVSDFSAYSATRSTVASLTSTRDAYERLMTLLADHVVTDIVAKLSR